MPIQWKRSIDMLHRVRFRKPLPSMLNDMPCGTPVRVYRSTRLIYNNYNWSLFLKSFVKNVIPCTAISPPFWLPIQSIFETRLLKLDISNLIDMLARALVNKRFLQFYTLFPLFPLPPPSPLSPLSSPQRFPAAICFISRSLLIITDPQ